MHVFSLERGTRVGTPSATIEKNPSDGSRTGQVTVACWEAGQTSPNHCHPAGDPKSIFCFSGGGTMRTPKESGRQ